MSWASWGVLEAGVASGSVVVAVMMSVELASSAAGPWLLGIGVEAEGEVEVMAVLWHGQNVVTTVSKRVRGWPISVQSAAAKESGHAVAVYTTMRVAVLVIVADCWSGSCGVLLAARDLGEGVLDGLWTRVEEVGLAGLVGSIWLGVWCVEQGGALVAEAGLAGGHVVGI